MPWNVDPESPGSGQPVVFAQASRGSRPPAPWLVADQRALPLRRWAPHWSFARAESVTEIVKRWGSHQAEVRDLLDDPATRETITTGGTPVHRLHLSAPIQPGQVFCTIGNYRRQVVQAAEDTGGPVDVADRRAAALDTLAQRRRDGDPYICLTSPDRVGRPAGNLVLGADLDTLDWEVEIGAVIGDFGADLTAAQATAMVAGYCVANDLTIRSRVARPDLPALGSDWLQSKGMAGSLPLGPWFVPAWQVPDPGRLRLRLTLNGDVMQDDTAEDMLFDIGEQLAYLSRHTRLRPGDLLCTGSPAGFGIHYGRFLRPCDELRASVTGLGEQITHCVESAPLAATHRTRQMEPTS